MRLVITPKYGPIHRFADHHVYKVLSILVDRKRRGRKLLADMVGIGEGSMRTILDNLRERRLIDVGQTGVRISSKGLEFFSKIPIETKPLPPSEMSLGESNVAVRIRGRGGEVHTGIEQRDSAIKAGADGATTIIVRSGRLLVPTDYDLDEERPEMARTLRDLFDLENDDVIVIGTAKESNRAEQGALAAAFEIL